MLRATGATSAVVSAPSCRTWAPITPSRWSSNRLTFSVCGDDVVAAAMIDRLVHDAEVTALKGGCYRIKDRDLGRVPTVTADDQ